MAWVHLGESYDRVARRFEEGFAHELEGKPRDRDVLTAFAASVAGPVVDVGCGPGQVGAYVGQWRRPVIGLDLSTEMARLARARVEATIVGDLRALPLAAGSVGGLLAFYSLIHVRRWELAAVIAEFHRVLRPGGRLLVSAHEGRGEVAVDELLGEPVTIAATLFELDELVVATQGAGLAVAMAERRPPYPNEGSTTRLYVEAQRPEPAEGSG